jgi:hypothetical protein
MNVIVKTNTEPSRIENTMNQNQERADRATEALQAAIISGDYDPEYAIADLLCDLKHAGHDIEGLCNRALGHFAAEIN